MQPRPEGTCDALKMSAALSGDPPTGIRKQDSQCVSLSLTAVTRHLGPRASVFVFASRSKRSPQREVRSLPPRLVLCISHCFWETHCLMQSSSTFSFTRAQKRKKKKNNNNNKKKRKKKLSKSLSVLSDRYTPPPPPRPPHRVPPAAVRCWS